MGPACSKTSVCVLRVLCAVCVASNSHDPSHPPTTSHTFILPSRSGTSYPHSTAMAHVLARDVDLTLGVEPTSTISSNTSHCRGLPLSGMPSVAFTEAMCRPSLALPRDTSLLAATPSRQHSVDKTVNAPHQYAPLQPQELEARGTQAHTLTRDALGGVGVQSRGDARQHNMSAPVVAIVVPQLGRLHKAPGHQLPLHLLPHVHQHVQRGG